MISPVWHETDAAGLAPAVAGHISECMRAAVSERGHASCVAPGGKTPGAILQALAAFELPWAQITFLPGDDRFVDAKHAASNFGLMQHALGATGARLMPLVEDQHLNDLEAAAAAASQRLASLPRPLDLVWLGMGADGHIASLFPGQPMSSPQAVMAAIPLPLPPEAPFPRLTLSLDALLDARELMIVIAGGDKKNVLNAALEQGSNSPYPVGALLAKCSAPVSVFWSP